MREIAVRADLDPLSLFFFIGRISRTVISMIERAVAEQAVKVPGARMAGKIPAVLVLKEAVRIFHDRSSPFSHRSFENYLLITLTV